MAKATGKKAASAGESEKKRKKPLAKAAATRGTTKARTSAKKAPAKTKSLAKKTSPAKKVAKKRPTATRAKASVKATKVATTVRSKRRTTATRPTAGAKKAAPRRSAVRARGMKPAVLDVPPSVIDTSSAAEVAARLVLDGTAPRPADPFHLFTPPPVVGLKRGSSALRHVKEMLHKPVAKQLEGVFGPAPVPPAAMKRFVRGEKAARTQRVRGTTNFHAGQSGVPHRSVG